MVRGIQRMNYGGPFERDISNFNFLFNIPIIQMNEAEYHSYY